MNKLKMILKVCGYILVFIIAVSFLLVIIARTRNSIVNAIDKTDGICENQYLEINGIKQFVQIRGENVNNPVIIFIHGGPASPMDFVSLHYQRSLEYGYTMINYEQRGCGRTYYANDESMDGVNVDNLVNDLDALVDYSRKKFKQNKVIVMGHSWGTILGTIYVKRHPDKVSAYIGVSQIGNLYKGKISVAEKALDVAKHEDENDASELENLIAKMKTVDKYEDLNVDDLIKMTSLSQKYLRVSGEMSSLKQMLVGVTSPDMNMTDVRWFLKQSNIQNFFDLESNLMDYCFFGFDLNEIECDYKVPVYYIAGEGDYAVSQEDVKKYYETINAPDKDFVMLPNVGHSMFMDNPDLFTSTVDKMIANSRAINEE